MDRNVQVYEFLLFSVFGKNAGPIDAAINRAYRDMAAHTMVFKKECDMNDGEKKEYKAEKKKDACIIIREKLEKLDNQTNYEKWIEELCNGIVAVYNEKNILELTFGQAQKWINMTMKYIYLFNIIAKTKDCNQIFGRFDFNNKDKWPEEINMIDRIVGEHKKNFYVPIDNYILGRLYELGKNEFNLYKEGDTYKICDGDKKFTWSKISEWKVYSAFNTKIKEYIGGKGKLPLEWEHEEWLKGSFFNM